MIIMIMLNSVSIWSKSQKIPAQLGWKKDGWYCKNHR